MSPDREFCKWYEEADVASLDYIGPLFTWKRGSTEARLDRVLANEAWMCRFPNARVTHLPFFKSDHRPLLLCLDSCAERVVVQRPFRFIASWVLHEDFNEFVKMAWDDSLTWTDNIVQFTDACVHWNRTVFGRIDHRKSKLLNRLDGISRAVRRVGNKEYYDNLQMELWKELEDVLIQESLLWAQKARMNWSVYGDRNSRFFHTQANGRRKRNRIDAICLEDGLWCYDEEVIKIQASRFFSNLFTEEIHTREELRSSVSFPPIDTSILQRCGQEVDEADIKKAVFSMGSLKSPGLDGFNALFYQNQWENIGRSVVAFVRMLFANPSWIRQINDTMLVLIPKKDPPENFKDLRPISLCNVIYKVVTKIVASRMKNFMPYIISPNQCSFVPGRQSSDNIIVAQEIIHSMRTMKGKKGFMAIKIDLEKAYDRVNWKFLIACLRELQMPESFIEVVSNCISTSRLQLLWNGSKAEFFQSSRGVRQGDPMSPYLFVICMEKLAHLIQERIEQGIWKPIRLTKNGPPISHLFFADDIILFAEASVGQAKLIKECLDSFCHCSGLKVNSLKTRMFFSENVQHSTWIDVSTILGFSRTMDLGKYLGVPLLHKRVTQETYQGVVDKVKDRLATWKINSLSLAGRTTLISSVTSAIPGYTMQTASLPASIWESLDQCNKSFLWGRSSTQRKISLVAWDSVCTAKRRGGLGLRHARYQNQAMLMKLGWQMVTRRDALWVQVVRDKYKCGNDLLPNIDLKRQGSNVWKGIKTSWAKVAGGLEVSTNGSSVRWKYDRSGIFSIRSAYDMISHNNIEGSTCWEKIWELRIPQRCKSFLWLAARKCLLTNATRHRRGLSGSSLCQVCGTNTEDMAHCLRDCRYTKLLWKTVVEPSRWHRFCSMSFEEWLWWNLRYKGSGEHDWGPFFALICWWLWRRRNLFIFEGKQVTNETMLSNVKAVLGSITNAQSHLAGSNIHGARLHVRRAAWVPPEPGWIKINVDGAFNAFQQTTACGGLARDSSGRFLHGFVFRMEQGDALTAELWACLHGLKLAWDAGYRQVMMESDSSNAIKLMQAKLDDQHEDRGVICEIQSLLRRDWVACFRHIDRGCNKVADYLAKEGLGSMVGFHLITQPTDLLIRLVEEDSVASLHKQHRLN